MKNVKIGFTALALLVLGMMIPNISNSQAKGTGVETLVIKQYYILGKPYGSPVIYCFGHPKDCWTGEVVAEQ
jgi:hypothetical protein